jgi:hypothetical protein
LTTELFVTYKDPTRFGVRDTLPGASTPGIFV